MPRRPSTRPEEKPGQLRSPWHEESRRSSVHAMFRANENGGGGCRLDACKPTWHHLLGRAGCVGDATTLDPRLSQPHGLRTAGAGSLTSCPSDRQQLNHLHGDRQSAPFRYCLAMRKLTVPFATWVSTWKMRWNYPNERRSERTQKAALQPGESASQLRPSIQLTRAALSIITALIVSKLVCDHTRIAVTKA